MNEELKNLLLVTGGLGLVGVPTLAAFLGHTQARAAVSLDKDKDFEVKKRQRKMLNDAIARSAV